MLMQVFVMQLYRMVLLAALTLSLVATGFAHRATGSEDLVAAQMAVAGVASDDICGELGQTGRHADSLCEACQLEAGADLPLSAGPLRKADLVLLAATPAPRENRRVPRVLDLSHTPQAPPLA